MIIEFLLLASSCGGGVAPNTLGAIVSAESDFNPFAIGVVAGKISRQPVNLKEAMETVARLEKNGFNYSVGLAQINKTNFEKYGLDGADIFEPCKNIRAGAAIITTCYEQANLQNTTDNLKSALSCYYSGQFDATKYPDYIERVISRSQINLASVSVKYGDEHTGTLEPIRISKNRPKANKAAEKQPVTRPMVSFSVRPRASKPNIISLGY